MESRDPGISSIGPHAASASQPEVAQGGAPPVTQLTLFLGILCSLLLTAVVLFLGFSWSSYRETYAAVDTGFRVGGSRLVEITLIREDLRNLSCASDVRVGALRCGFDGAHAPVSGLPERETLRPYNTVKNELLLVAGLWSELAEPEALPRARFTVVCDYHVTSVIKSAELRWAPSGKFDRLDRSVPVGFVKNCQIP
ncbi:MAG TPA: hypothetical protein VFQ35_06485, partial [Polyangiaceae bacterium]|nr:hypothetical protein [Polyangiaceae bacterium]